jgi:DNA gyrase/topoisomerase IV subunit A
MGTVASCAVDFDVETLLARLHKVEGVLSAVENWTDISDLVSGCEDRESAIHALSAPPFSFSVVQAELVLDTPLVRRTGVGRRQLEEERDRTLSAIGRFTRAAGHA